MPLACADVGWGLKRGGGITGIFYGSELFVLLYLNFHSPPPPPNPFTPNNVK